MIFIYEKTTGKVKVFYQGDISQISNYDNEDWAEAHFPDDKDVIDNPYDYKVIIVNNLPVAYHKKPKLELSFDKLYITGDGVDEATLTVNVTEVHPFEIDKYNTVKIYINREECEVSNGDNIAITSDEDQFNIRVTGDHNIFRVTEANLEVI